MNFLDDNEVTRGLMRFLDASPTALFAAKNLGGELDRNGYTRLYEGEAWNLREGQGYYVCRNESALIAFRVPGRDFRGFQILAGHLDSPLFHIKTNAEIGVDAKYVKLNTEGYGGMLMAPWLDRPLSVAGRVVVRTENGVESRLVNIDRDLLIIPNVAIHMNREANSGMKFNAQTDLLPLLGTLPAAEKKMEPPLRRCGAGMGVEDTSDTSAAGAPERMEEGRDSALYAAHSPGLTPASDSFPADRQTLSHSWPYVTCSFLKHRAAREGRLCENSRILSSNLPDIFPPSVHCYIS